MKAIVAVAYCKSKENECTPAACQAPDLDLNPSVSLNPSQVFQRAVSSVSLLLLTVQLFLATFADKCTFQAHVFKTIDTFRQRLMLPPYRHDRLFHSVLIILDWSASSN